MNACIFRSNFLGSAAIKIFEERKVRSLWDEDKEQWYFSIVDVISILTESPNPRKYWSVLKTGLKTEGSQLTTNCSQLKMQSSDGKYEGFKIDFNPIKIINLNLLKQYSFY